MKVRVFWVTLALCLVPGILFASCGKEAAVKENGTDTTASTYAETEKETSPETVSDTIETTPLETEPNEDPRVPIENEKALSFIEFQYAKALDAISFAEGQLDCDYNTEMISEEGIICYPIADSAERDELEGGHIDSFEDLSKYLRSIFARSIADDLIDKATELYMDIDGVLCLKTEKIAGETETESEKVTETTEETETTEGTEVQTEEETSSEEEPPILIVASTEYFLSQFTDKLFRYTAKVSFEGTEEAEYFDFIFENTGSGWYFTQFPALPE